MVTDIHQAVINLAKELGVILADRNASLSWMYDGKSVALWHRRELPITSKRESRS